MTDTDRFSDKLRLFDPAQYRPRQTAGVEVLDRGENEPHERFVLQGPAGGILPVAADDLLLWRMFDGNRSVQDVLAAYVQEHKTLPMDRVLKLLRELWGERLLAENPGFSAREDATDSPERVAAPARIRVPLPAGREFSALLRQAGLPLLANAPLVSMLGLLALVGLLVGLVQKADLALRFGLYSAPPATGRVILVCLVVNLALSFFRELAKCLAAMRLGGVQPGWGLQLRFGVPLFYCDLAGMAGKPRRERLAAGLAGLLADLAVAGALILLWNQGGQANSEFWLALLTTAYARVFFSACPLLKNDLYLVLCDWTRQRRLRQRLGHFFTRNFGRPLAQQARDEALAYVGVGALAVIWLDTGLRFLHDMFFVEGGGGGALIVGFTVGIPAMGIAVSFLIWGVRLAVRRARPAADAETDGDGGTLVLGLVLLALITAMIFKTSTSFSGVMPFGVAFVLFFAAFASTLKLQGLCAMSRPGIRYCLLAVVVAAWWMGSAFIFDPYIIPRAPEMARLAMLAAAVCGAAYLVSLLMFPDFFSRGPLAVSELLVVCGQAVLFPAALALRADAELGVNPENLPFGRAGMVLGAGLLLLGIFRPVRVALAGAPAPAPYPFDLSGKTDVVELRTLAYFLTSVKTSLAQCFGAAAGETADRIFARHAKGKNWRIELGDPFKTLGTQDATPEAFEEIVQTLKKALDGFCGAFFVDRLFRRILAEVHWDQRVGLWTRVFPGEKLYAPVFFDRNERLKVLQAVHLLRGLDEEDLHAFGSSMELRHYDRGDLIVAQGGDCAAFYLVVNGTASVEERDVVGETYTTAYLKRGDFFGEAVLGRNRSAVFSFNVRASSPLDLRIIRRLDIDNYLRTFPSAAAKIRDNLATVEMLRRTPIFTELSPTLVNFLLARVEHRRAAAGEYLVRQGEIGQEFFLIRKGKVDVLADKDGRQEKVSELGTGDYFGEIALLMDVPRTASVRAQGEVEACFIQKADFLSLRSGSREFKQDLQQRAESRLGAEQNDRPER